jgi:hypothetical protein
MPRGESWKQDAAKKLQSAGKAPGQTSLPTFFMRPDNDQIIVDCEDNGNNETVSDEADGTTFVSYLLWITIFSPELKYCRPVVSCTVFDCSY